MNMDKDTLELTYIGRDHFLMPVYKDQFDHFWKDTNLGKSEALDLRSSFDFDGDPCFPINQPFKILVKPDISEREFDYMM